MPSFLTAADAVCKRWEMRRFAVLAEVFHWRLGTSQSASPTSRVALYQLYRADDQQAQVHLQACTRDQHQNTLCNNRTWISRVSYIRGVKWLLLLLFNAMSAAMVILRPDFMAPSCMCVQVMNICDNEAIYNQSRKKIKTLGRLGHSPRVKVCWTSLCPSCSDRSSLVMGRKRSVIIIII